MKILHIILLSVITTIGVYSQTYHVINVPSHDTLNVRTGAGTKNEKIGELSHNARGIKVLECKDSSSLGRWCSIVHNSNGHKLFGWVSSRYLAKSSSTKSSENSLEDIVKLAKAYYYGTSKVKQDYNEAKELFIKAINLGSVDGYRYLGTMYLFGHGVKADKSEAEKWLNKAIALDDRSAKNLYETYIAQQTNTSTKNEHITDTNSKNNYEAQKQKTRNQEIQEYMDSLRNNFDEIEKQTDYSNTSDSSYKKKKLIFTYQEMLKEAESGDAYYQAIVGDMLRTGDGVKKDLGTAYIWIKKSSDQGHPIGLYNLAYLFKKGYQVNKDKEKSDALYTQAFPKMKKLAEDGDPVAQFKLSWMYENGAGITKDMEKAFNWIKLSAKQDYLSAYNTLGQFFRYAKGVEKDYSEALKWYRKGAQEGDKYAQYNLGDMYYYGNGLEKDYAEAFSWYEKSAEKEFSLAQSRLGYMYKKGQGVEKNSRKAFKWYEKSAKQGSTKAQFNLGNMYYSGQGIKKDMSQAFKWFKKSAEKGHIKSQYSLGVMSVENVKYSEAEKWFKKAADQGHNQAKYELALLYFNGTIQGDKKYIINLFSQAAKGGVKQANYYLGMIYISEDYFDITKALSNFDIGCKVYRNVDYYNGNYCSLIDNLEDEYLLEACKGGHNGACIKLSLPDLDRARELDNQSRIIYNGTLQIKEYGELSDEEKNKYINKRDYETKKEQWRLDQVRMANEYLDNAHEHAKKVKPYIKISCERKHGGSCSVYQKILDGDFASISFTYTDDGTKIF